MARKSGKGIGCGGCLLIIVVFFAAFLILNMFMLMRPETQPAPTEPEAHLAPTLPSTVALPEGCLTNYEGYVLLLDHEGKLIGEVKKDHSVQYPDEEKPVGRVRRAENRIGTFHHFAR